MAVPSETDSGTPVSGALCFEVSDVFAGKRIDVALSSLAEIPRSAVQRWIAAERVWVNDRTCRASFRVSLGDEVKAWPLDPVVPSLVPEPIALVVLYEDRDLIVIDKPPGLVVHPAPGHPRGTLVNALLHHCGDLAGVGGVLRPGIVHRLDRGTSGVMVAAKNDLAHRGLAQQFHDHSIERVYRALVRELPATDEGMVDRPIGRHPRDRKRMSVATRAGRSARTRWEVFERFATSRRSDLTIRPETGRTHQIRVHLASIGLPIVGDAVYGRSREAEIARPALHAAVLGFVHPESGKRVRFEAAMPADMQELLSAYRSREPVS